MIFIKSKWKIIFKLASLLLIVALIGFRIFLYTPETWVIFENIFYWVFFAVFLFSTFLWNLMGVSVILVGVIFLSLGGFFNVIGSTDFSEYFLKLFVVILTVGLLKIFYENEN